MVFITLLFLPFAGCARVALWVTLSFPGQTTNPGAKRVKELEQECNIHAPFLGACGACSLMNEMTLGNGYLGSRIDEERSEMRYLV